MIIAVPSTYPLLSSRLRSPCTTRGCTETDDGEGHQRKPRTQAWISLDFSSNTLLCHYFDVRLRLMRMRCFAFAGCDQ